MQQGIIMQPPPMARPLPVPHRLRVVRAIIIYRWLAPHGGADGS